MGRIKTKIYRYLKQVLTPVASKFGFYPNLQSQYNKSNLLINSLNYLKQSGFNPETILDIGANHGTWTRDVLKIFPNSKYYLVEPQGKLERSIEDLKYGGNVKFYPFGIGSKNGTFEFSINQSDDSSSFQPMDLDIEGYKFVEKIQVPMLTLDSFLEKNQIPVPNLVKIDAEGLDLEVLQGANSIFGETECILIEASIHQKAFPNSLLKVLEAMDEKGYEIFDFTDLNRPFANGLLWLVEILFIKKDSNYLY